ncbi:MAG: diguanylate cyclase [Lachnospiraceae bacterium]|nr:diguanylate cyclase [Lachnospiraceae bacterium]
MIKKEKKLTIGLIVEDVFTDFAKDIIQNVIQSIPENKNIEVVVIAGKFVDDFSSDFAQKRYKVIYNSIYRLEEICKFDGILIALGSMAKIKKQIIDSRFLTNLQDVPKVFMVSDFENMISVNYDNETGIREAVDYLVNACNLTQFAMLGGRDDNVDSRRRKSLYIKSLKMNGISFSEDAYEPTDMSVNSEEAAARLLRRKPKTEVIFCVNDAVAVGLYKVMKRKGLVPGRDIKVFGFDNTRMAGDMKPSLATIGAESETLGQKSLELLLAMINGADVKSVRIPTRLYGRESCDYEMYEYTTLEMLNVDEAFIYKMFDDCFYRYRYEYIDRRDVNLKRLFFEFTSKILYALKNRYMSEDEFEEIKELIDIFFDNGAINYTDASKLIKSIERLQRTINEVSKSFVTNMLINRAFQYMRNKAIIAFSNKMIKQNEESVAVRNTLENFLVECTDFSKSSKDLIEVIVRNFDKLGFENSAFYLFDEPAVFEKESTYLYPDEIRLRCYTKNGDLFVIPEERQRGALSDIFRREELYSNYMGYIAFPIVFKDYIYGILVCELSKDIYDKGDYIADQLGRTMYSNHTQEAENIEFEKRTYGLIAESLASKYEEVYYVNSANGDYYIYKEDDRRENMEVKKSGKGFFDSKDNVTRDLIHPDDIDRINEVMTAENLIEMLKNRKQISLEYRRLINNEVNNMRLSVLWSSDKIHFVMGIENIDEEIEKEEEHVRELTNEREMARRDDLTGIKNKNAYREFEESMQKKIDSKTEITPFSLLVCDINNLKQINDKFGHKAGDEYIKASSKMICEVYTHSPVFRIGGDEFVVVLSGDDYFNREKLLKKIRAKVIKNLKQPETPVVATGLADFDSRNDKSVSNVFVRADAKMYENKNFLKYI